MGLSDTCGRRAGEMWRDVGGAGKVPTWVSAEPVEPRFITYLPIQAIQQLMVEGGPPRPLQTLPR